MEPNVLDRLSSKLQRFYSELDADEQRLFATIADAPDDEVSGFAETVHLYFRSILPGLPTAARYENMFVVELIKAMPTQTSFRASGEWFAE